MIRTFTTRKGRTVETHLTDDEALAICRNLESPFARDLAVKAARGLSHDQWAWVHILAVESLTPKQEAAAPAMVGAVRLLTNAAKHLRFPKVRLETRREQLPVVLSLAGERSRFPGSVTVTSEADQYGDRRFYGRIHVDGRFEPGRIDAYTAECVTELLTEFAADPAAVAARYGRLTGSCCFCARGLSDERSTAVGYGQICSEHFSLPYPKRTEALQTLAELAA